VNLNVATNVKSVGVTPHERCVPLAPIAPELLASHVLAAVSVFRDDHAPRWRSSSTASGEV
jgi:hypothetical protein